jgi:hypothetical protein
MATETIENALRGMKGLPAKVHAWEIEEGADSTGHRAVWVWVVLEEDNVDFERRSVIRDKVRDEVRRVATPEPEWVYVRFRTASEVADE